MGFALAAASKASASTSTSASSDALPPSAVGALGLIAKVPFLLILDTLDRCTVAEAENFWSYVEAVAPELTRPELFSKGS